MVKDKLNKKLWVIDIVIIAILLMVFSYLYLSSHAWGAWGDDAPGYMYLAGQMMQHQPLVHQDKLVQEAIQYFQQERFSRFVAPANSDILAPSGWVASHYPLGLSLLMYLAAVFMHNDTAIYLVAPLLGMAAVLLTYWLTLLVLPLNLFYKRVAAIMVALAVGLCSLFINYTVAEPMRDIPALTFFLASCCVIFFALRGAKLANWKKNILVLLAGALYGYSIDIRETSVVLFLPLIFLITSFQQKLSLKKIVCDRIFWKTLAWFCLGILITSSIFIWNVANISAHKTKFKVNDVSSVAITSNINDVKSLSLSNLFNNQGKFLAGTGGVVQYWNVLNQFNAWPPFLVVALIGLVGLWKYNQRLAYFFVTWFGTIFILFSLWVNPYDRYILPVLPAVAMLSVYGVFVALQWLREQFQLTQRTWVVLAVLVVVSFFAYLQPLLAQREQDILNHTLIHKSLSLNDLDQLKTITATIQAQPNAKPNLLLMLSKYEDGISETMMTHSNLRVMRFPVKPNETAPITQVIPFLNQLTERYQLYVWYDDTANANEVQYFNQLQKQLLQNYSFSFDNNVQLYAITN